MLVLNYNTLHCILHYITLHCKLHYIANYITLHCKLHFIANYIPLQTTLHYIANYITLQTTLHYITLHYITLQTTLHALELKLRIFIVLLAFCLTNASRARLLPLNLSSRALMGVLAGGGRPDVHITSIRSRVSTIVIPSLDNASVLCFQPSGGKLNKKRK